MAVVVVVKGVVVVLAKKNIAGVVLAGGQSSRMGQNKAQLDYNGKPLLEHMIGVLEHVGLNDIYVSGEFDGYRCISDQAPYEGPAYAIYDVLKVLKDYDGVLFVPIDMPLLHVNALHLLMGQEKGSYFTGFPLPAFIANYCLKERTKSVQSFLKSLEISPIFLPSEFEFCMVNANTPEEWKEVLSA